jgi:nitrous oxidase accessory protein NosD
MTPLLLLACAGAPSSLLAPTLSADRWTQAALLPPAWLVCPGTGDFDAIQDAIDAASDGDTIEVCTGTYNEDLVIEKPLTLIDQGGMTTIDGSGTTSVIAIETAGLVTIDGFVIQGGAATNGGGIYAMGMDLTLDLRGNLVQRNTATNMGGGVYLGRGIDGLFTENVFQLNVADMGGGIASMMSDVTIQGNHIHRNDCTTTDATASSSAAARTSSTTGSTPTTRRSMAAAVSSTRRRARSA